MSKPVVIAGVAALMLISVGLYLRQRQSVTAQEAKPEQDNEVSGWTEAKVAVVRAANSVNPLYDVHNEMFEKF